MEARAHIKYVRVSPLKLRSLVDAIRILPVQHALDRLHVSRMRSAQFLYRALKSAADNGRTLPGFDALKARIKILKIDEGPVYKRFRAGAKGIAKPYVRKSSHITVVVEQADILVEKKALPQKIQASEPEQKKVTRSLRKK